MKKILIANRGEIAVRIIRACQEMDIKAVAVYSTADKQAMHVKIADEAICIGSERALNSYADPKAIISAATVTNCDGIHPGYGFLSENADFIEMVEEHNFTFIGPSSKHVNLMGDKITAKKTAIEIGLPIVPGSNGEVATADEALQIGKEFGYPVLIKASAGGGGKGMRIVLKQEDMVESFNSIKKEAQMAYGNSAVYIEKYLLNPKHIEVQVLGDKHGNVIHLFERDCSVQRRNQKVIEEALGSTLSQADRDFICNSSAKAMQKLGYYSAGTIEYLYEDGKFYFMEMNTRLQVEHPVTEAITGVDLVYEMIKIAMGKPLKYKQSDIVAKGHAIECRINAEDSKTFVPTPGKITHYHPPAGLGVRVDTAVYSGYTIPPFYDSMILKLIVTGRNREHCLKRLSVALDELILEGTVSNIDLHKNIIKQPEFIAGTYSIKWLEKLIAEQNASN